MEEDDNNPQQGGSELQVSVFSFKAIVQAVLLFGSETWVVTPRMGRVLGGFQDQVAQRLTGRLAQQKLKGSGNTTRHLRQGKRQGYR